MGKNKNQFQDKLLRTFQSEAEERLERISTNLLLIERQSVPDKKLVEEIYRDFHSLKGASRSVNLSDIERICHSVENVFFSIKNSKIKITKELISLIIKTSDYVRRLIQKHADIVLPETNAVITGILNKLQLLSEGKEITLEDKTNLGGANLENPVLDVTLSDNIKISGRKLKQILLQLEEIIPNILSVKQLDDDITGISENLKVSTKELSILQNNIISSNDYNIIPSAKSRINAAKSNLNQTERFIDVKDNFNDVRTSLREIENQLLTVIKRSRKNSYVLQNQVNQLIYDIKETLMLPFSSLTDKFQGMVRTLGEEHKKEVELIVTGDIIKIDRRILEEIYIPFLHLIRNSIDHGIEKPEERIRFDKSTTGKIKIHAQYKTGNNFEIIISDDGKGINVEKLKTAALKLGIVNPEEVMNLNKNEILNLIFYSGLTTSLIITDISGRGLGLAIVKSVIEKLNGTISIETKETEGTTFRITLPIKLTTFSGILVKEKGHLFIIPTSGVEKVIKIKSSMIKTVENKRTIQFENLTIPLVSLNAILSIAPGKKESYKDEKRYAVIISTSGTYTGIMVDEVIKQEETLVKNFTKPLLKVKNMLGASSLASGELVPVVDLRDLSKSAFSVKAGHLSQPSEIKKLGKEEENKSILLVEDSITARTLLKNILEGAGYNVKTAVDGIDAFTKLRTEKFDVVVSDVEMPRMNGFELTSKIRADKRLSELPVVLVTALESKEDREKGIEVGATAYIVKSTFEQSNLLEVIERVI